MLRRRLRRFSVIAEQPGSAVQVVAVARTARSARRMVVSFLTRVEDPARRYSATAQPIEGEPEYGDLGATPLGRSAQVVADVRKEAVESV